jgi:hypothetical protein
MKPRRSKWEIDHEKQGKAIRRFWKENPLAHYDPQWRLRVDMGSDWVNPLEFPFDKRGDVKGFFRPTAKLWTEEKVCGWCDRLNANIWRHRNFEAYWLCIGCFNRSKKFEREMQEYEAVSRLIKDVRKVIREQDTNKDQRGPAPVSDRDDAGGEGRGDRSQPGSGGMQDCGTNQ